MSINRALAGAGALVMAIILAACPAGNDDHAPVAAYFEQAYAPVRIAAPVAAAPQAHRIASVPWIAYSKALCQTASLEMLAPGAGLERDLSSFLLGYTYGALYVRGAGHFMSYGDPEPGFAVAAETLGLDRHYRVTDDPSLFVAAIRETLARDVPVRLAWNSARAVEAAVRAGFFTPGPDWQPPSPQAFSPHSVVLVGYEGETFYYYETGGRDQRRDGEAGIAIDQATLLEAVSSLSARFRLPWRYMLLTLEGEPQSPADLSAAWRRNGEELLGIEFGPSLTGSRAIAGLAAGIDQDGEKLVASAELRRWLRNELGRLHEQRRDGSVFIERTFATPPAARSAAAELNSAAEAYAAALQLLAADAMTIDEMARVAALLREAAEHERRAGDAFLAVAGGDST